VRISEDTSDLVFRVLFSTIFVGLGLEHLFSDDLLQAMIPDWIGEKRLASVAAGVVLLLGGCSIMLGYHVHLGAAVLGGFLITVTVIVHAPGLVGHYPASLPDASRWLWQVYQRSNFVKNICLLGVCVHLFRHTPGRYSLDGWRSQTAGAGHDPS
jgi:uncharacterized membrane protein YphA (DoxX/SURF4 family)